MNKQLTGQKTVTASGIPVSLGTGKVDGALFVKADPANSGYIYLGNSGLDTVSSSTGYILAAGEAVVFDYIDKLDNLYVNSSVNSQKVCWLIPDQSLGVHR